MAVVGLGLVGGSLARALSRAGFRVVGVDVSASTRRRARAAGAVVRTVSTPEAAATLADVLVLAAPPRASLRILSRLARSAPPGLVVTDVASVKAPICREARRLGRLSFVGGHPMAGRELSGFDASSADLFRERPWILTPGPAGAMRLVSALVRATGARPLVLAPAMHDRVAAFLSHLPQLTAWALWRAARHEPVVARHLSVAGPGFRDMTRLAASPGRLWREILELNRAEVGSALAAFKRALAQVQAASRD